MLSKSIAVANGERYGPFTQMAREVGRIMVLCNSFDQSPSAAMQTEEAFSSLGWGNTLQFECVINVCRILMHIGGTNTA